MAYYYSKILDLNIYSTFFIVVPLMFILGVLIQKLFLSRILEGPEICSCLLHLVVLVIDGSLHVG